MAYYKASGVAAPGAGTTPAAVRLQLPAAAGAGSGAVAAAVLPDLTVTDSSEALLTGRRPPFRLLARALAADGAAAGSNAAAAAAGAPSVRPAVSEEFVVATRRVKQANKAEIPLIDDPVSKIEHVGRETAKKLADLRAAAAEAGQALCVDDRMAAIVTGARLLRRAALQGGQGGQGQGAGLEA